MGQFCDNDEHLEVCSEQVRNCRRRGRRFESDGLNSFADKELNIGDIGVCVSRELWVKCWTLNLELGFAFW